MSVTVANTELVDSFNTWRLNTNLMATIIANNAVTVSPGGDAARGTFTVGDGHIIGNFSATTLKADTILGGNTSNDAALTIGSNTSFNATTVTFNANTVFTGNVDFNTVGTDRIDFGGVDKWRLTGGNNGEFLRQVGTDRVEFKKLTLRDVGLYSNSAHLILSGANTSFAQSPSETPALKFINANDTIQIFMANGAGASGESDLIVNLADNAGESKFTITNLANTEMATINSQGKIVANNVTANTVTLPGGDVQTQISQVAGDALAFAIALG